MSYFCGLFRMSCLRARHEGTIKNDQIILLCGKDKGNSNLEVCRFCRFQFSNKEKFKEYMEEKTKLKFEVAIL